MTSLFFGDGLSVYYIFTSSPSSALTSGCVWTAITRLLKCTFFYIIIKSIHVKK